ncbi:MAG TPA: tetratricopeptide repeat protein [Candidatus Polarisedimenticolia bacterium]|nr:tetratricopeptide repeat protein [Candidatus Polarisedimenticolia bacterium]
MDTDSQGDGVAPAPRWSPAKAAALVAVAALFLLVLALSLTRATDTDLWWHLASGDLIRRTGEVPRSDPFSYTVIGHRWIDIHWLFQVVLSALYEAGGVRALDVARSAILLGIFAWLYRRCRRDAGASTVVGVLFVVVLACQERFLTRPEIVSWGFLLAVIAALERALDAAGSDAARARSLYLVLPALTIAWVNVQSLFILAPIFIVLALFASLIELMRARPGSFWPAADAPAGWSDVDRPIALLVALAVSVVACLINPYGAVALRFPFEQFFVALGGKSLLSRTIAEFQPPLSGDMVTPSIVAFVVLAAATILVLLADAGRVRALEVLISAATLVLALRARRNIPIFALAAAPILARHAAGLLKRATDRTARAGARERAAIAAPVVLAAAALWMTFDVASDRFFLRRPTERWFGSGEIPDYFPEDAARFVAANGIPGNVFHSLWAGGYLIHAWRGERGVFIDGRNDPYLDDVLPAYLKAIADPSEFEDTVARYQITAVIWSHQRALEGKRLLAYLARSRGWILVHLDAAAAVYLRADVLSAARLAESPFTPGRDPADTYRILARALDRRPFSGPPIREISLGEFFSVSGDPVGSEFFFQRAVEKMPRSAPVLYGYALALERQNRTREACDAYGRAAAADPGHLPSRAATGACLLDKGDVEAAGRELQAAYRGGERSARLLVARARLFEQKSDTAGAIAAYQEAIQVAPRDTTVLRSMALFLARHDQPSEALSFYTRAAGIDPDDPVIAGETASLLDRLGRTDAALDVARDASRRAMERLESGGPAGWVASGPSREDDRRLLALAAALEERAGDRARAAQYRDALARSGGGP